MSWDWAVPIRERIFGAPLHGGYRLERVDEDSYWDLHEAELREHFPPDAMFDRGELVDRGRRDRVIAAEGADQLADFWLVRTADGALAGMVSARQRSADTFEPSNNAVLIRHLKAGFRIIAMDIDPAHGTSVRLAYFHEPALLKAYEFRCGLATMDETLYRAGTGHFSLLDEQFAAARAAAQRVRDD